MIHSCIDIIQKGHLFMKRTILWICNLIFPDIALKIGAPVSYAGGWLLGASNELKKHHNISLGILAPSDCVDEITTLEHEGIQYIAMPKHDYVRSFEMVKKQMKPSIVHVFGTELPHAWDIFKVFKPSEVVISMQGIISECASYYCSDLPNFIIKRKGIYELVTMDSLVKQKNNFRKRGIKETNVLKQAKYVIGRTDWDYAVVQSINPNITYMKCNETLRSSFYHTKWNISTIERYSIFISQGSYPIKGLHNAILGLAEIKKEFQKVKLYVAGENILKNSVPGKRWKMSSYARYIYDLINDNDLEGHVVFLGNLNENEMRERYLKAHVYLCSSVIENSPNSLGEAMLIGVPCVASWVGGIPTMLKHEEEGYLYQYNAVKMMSYYIKQVFKDDEKAKKLSYSARRHATITHDPVENNRKLLEIYSYILGEMHQ